MGSWPEGSQTVRVLIPGGVLLAGTPELHQAKLRRLQSNRQHLFEKKSSTRTRRLDGMVDVHPGDEKKIKRLLAER